MQCLRRFDKRQAEQLQGGKAGVRSTDPFRSRVAGIILRGQVGVTLRSAGSPGTIRVNHSVSCSRHGTEYH